MVLQMAVIIDVSDTAVVCSGRLWICHFNVEVVVGVACTCTARVDERRAMCTLDEVTSWVDTRKQAVEPLIQRVVAVRKWHAWVCSYDNSSIWSINITSSTLYWGRLSIGLYLRILHCSKNPFIELITSYLVSWLDTCSISIDWSQINVSTCTNKWKENLYSALKSLQMYA